MLPAASSSSGLSQGNSRVLLMTAKVVSLLAAVFAMLVFCLPGLIRGQAYAAFREVSRAGLLLRTYDMNSRESEHFVVRYQPEDSKYVRLVLDTAEHFYTPVAGRFNFTAHHKIPVIIYPTGSELNASFGWSASESTMGVYWAGAIRVLSPAAWVMDRESAGMRETFISSGPMAHELTHLAVDYATRGNCPRWLTEGLAQYEDYRLTGFRFDTPLPAISDLYPLARLDGDFDSMKNQSVAYYQSLSAVEYIVAVYGEGALDRMIKDLGQGRPISRVMQDILNVNLEQFEQSWHGWLKNVENHSGRQK